MSQTANQDPPAGAPVPVKSQPGTATPMPETTSTAPRAARAMEKRSIDWVPNNERHGKLRGVGAIWFVGNVNLTAMATGTAALAAGAGLMWTIVATVLGSLFGTFFMAFHSAQGPQLGLPQLVQSRPQFGYIGAAITVFIAALVNYVAFNTSDALLSGSATNLLFAVPPRIGFTIAAVLAAVLALFGYDWIHKVNKWLTFPLLGLMGILTVAALTNGALPAGAFDLGEFNGPAFLTVFVIMAGFQLGWAPYVSDYSRYLPASIGVKAAFWWTYLPSAISGIWVFVLGAIMAAASPGADPVTGFLAAAVNFGGPVFGWIVIAALLVGVLSVMGINQYGGSLTMISILDSFRPVKPTLKLRAITIGLMFVLVFGISQVVGIDSFNAFYGNVLIFIAYVFTPWTAINLVDFFFVRKGKYVIGEIFNPDGIYGRWGWRGTTAYLVGIAAMIPFMVTAPFVGSIAQGLGSVDYSIFVGLPVAGILYLVLCRSLDLDKEQRMVDAEGLLLHDKH
ncbi:purine-cytosine permease family protein [Arthrobacter sp. NPDC058127]|uniref:purine-cytosine permease family protein n=1 Tax=Arthrobacter sp. NPDC058127 TaxID=3346351 RepID=UPI0036ED7551